MASLRLLNTGVWNKPPVLAAARSILMRAASYGSRRETLGELASFVNGTNYDRGLLSDDGVPIIRIANISDPATSYIRTRQQFEHRFVVQPGDLLVSWSASFKSLVWPGPSGILNQHIFKVSPFAGTDAPFLRHAIEAAFDDMQQSVVGIGMMHLRRADFLGHTVSVPDLETQRAVGAYLDWIETGSHGEEPSLPAPFTTATSRISRVREFVQASEVARSLCQTSAAYRVRLLQAHLDDVVADLERRYRQAPLSDLVVATRGISYGIVLTGTPDDTGVPTLRAGDLHMFNVALDNVKRVAPEVEAQYRRTRLEGNEVLLRIRGGIGEVAVCPPEMVRGNVSREIAVIPLLKEVNPAYAMYVLAARRSQSRMRDELRGTSYVGINLADVRRLPIPVPPEDVQVAIVKSVSKVRQMVAALGTLQTERNTQVDALIPAIIHAATRGLLAMEAVTS